MISDNNEHCWRAGAETRAFLEGAESGKKIYREPELEPIKPSKMAIKSWERGPGPFRVS